jgi:F-type H+-transporting ATPase subunit b
MRKHVNTLIGLVASAFFLAWPLVLWAAAEEGHGGHAEDGSQQLTLVFSAINLTLFIFALRKYALPAIRESLKKRRDAILQALNEGKKAREEAEVLRQEYERKLAGLAAEQERMRQQALADAEREKERLLTEARRMVERVRAEAQQTVQRELEEARRRLRQEVTTQAVQLASAIIRSSLTSNDQSRLVREFVQGVYTNAGNDALR